MKSLPFRLTAIAILSLTFAAPALGERMADPGAPPPLAEPTTEPEMTEPDAAMEDPEDTKPNEDSIRVAEPADDSEAEMGAKRTPALPPRLWKFSAAFTINAFYDNNILISSRDREADEILRASANFGFTWGDYLKKKDSYLAVHYAPSWLFFSDHSSLNGFEQEGSFIGQWRTGKLTLDAVAEVQKLIGGDVDVGARADRIYYQLGIKTKYDLSERASVEVNVFRNANDYQTYLSSVEWVNQNWVDFQIWPKTRVGVGLTLGQLSAQNSDVQTYEQALARFAYEATDKFTISGSGGTEFRQLGTGLGTQSRPVFNVGASYRPFDSTCISLDATRRIYSSALEAATNYTATFFTLNVRQRFLQKFFATFAGGYEDARYEGTSSSVTTSRHDEFIFIRPSIAVALTKSINLELYYKYRCNGSTDNLLSFSNNIVGLQATIAF